MLHFNGFGIDGVVLGMRADKFHVNRLVAIGHRYDQAIVIALDVEDYSAILEDAGASVLFLDVRRPLPICLLDFINPRL